MTDTSTITQQFWDNFYAAYSRGEHDGVNHYLAREVEHLPPGTALDLGCAEGTDAIWLAGHGWRVTAVDVSGTALDRARTHAKDLDVSQRIVFERHDLAVSFPQGQFDLVSAQFLHSPVGGPEQRARILARAAAAVAPGGHLLVVSHQSMPPWHGGMPAGLTDQPLNFTVPSPQENLAALRLAEGEWDTLRAESLTIDMTGPAGQSGSRTDHALHFRRRTAAA